MWTGPSGSVFFFTLEGVGGVQLASHIPGQTLPERMTPTPTRTPANALKSGLNIFCFPAEKELTRLITTSLCNERTYWP
jgi:hypothetical protein